MPCSTQYAIALHIIQCYEAAACICSDTHTRICQSTVEQRSPHQNRVESESRGLWPAAVSLLKPPSGN